MGRHSTFTQEIADEICERLSKGEPLEWICRDDHMPSSRAVHYWSGPDETRPPEVPRTFASDFARARAAGHDFIAADTLRIADTPMLGEETTVKADGSREVKYGDMLGHRKLQIETRLKLLAKWDKRYGDKVQTEHSGSLGVTVQASSIDEEL